METIQGRPKIDAFSDATDALSAVFDFLDGTAVPYATVLHEQADTMELCRAIEAYIHADLGAHIPKNLFLCNRQKTQYYLLLMPGDKPFHTKDLSAQINSARLSFADADAMYALMKTRPGSVSVLGLLFDTEKRIQLLIDSDLLSCASLGVHPIDNHATVVLSLSALTDAILPALSHAPIFVTLPKTAPDTILTE